MTHAEALERSRRALDSRPDCQHELVDFGLDRDEPSLRHLCCARCQIILRVDPIGVIRETWAMTPAQAMAVAMASELEVDRH
jgi:hypothetical protein